MQELVQSQITQIGMFDYIMGKAITLSVLTLFFFIWKNFKKARRDGEVSKEKRSIVATFTMTMFFVIIWCLITMKIGVVPVTLDTHHILGIIGTGIIILGVVVNIIGRYKLGTNWGDHVRIYKEHTLVTTGVYSIVRHPLYASIIWMFYGASLAYNNWLAAVLTTIIFVPFMYYRASQEEKLLAETFGAEYDEYKKRVRMMI